MHEITEMIAWRTTKRMLGFSKRRLRFYFVEEWVRFFFYTFPLAAAPTFVSIVKPKVIPLESWALLLGPFGLTAGLSAIFAYAHVLSAAQHIKSEYDLGNAELRVRNQARQLKAHWNDVRKWSLQPHPYAAGMHLLRFHLIAPLESSKVRHIDMEIDPQAQDIPQIEAFIANRVGFEAAQ